MHLRRLPQPQVRTCYSCLPFSSLSSPFPLETSWSSHGLFQGRLPIPHNSPYFLTRPAW